MIAGVIGTTANAVREASLARDLGYDVALVAFTRMDRATHTELLQHLDAVAEVMPVMAFYLQPAVGGRTLDSEFWRQCLRHPRVVAVKIAPFDRYQTLDVVRAAAGMPAAARPALYTGNDDHIMLDLATRFRARGTTVRMVGGLLGQWAMWTHTAVRLHRTCVRIARSGRPIPASLATIAAQLTDANGAIFDAPHRSRGCIAGILEVLRRQRLLRGRWTIDRSDELSSGQDREITRVVAAYPHLADDAFVLEHRDRWLA